MSLFHLISECVADNDVVICLFTASHMTQVVNVNWNSIQEKKSLKYQDGSWQFGVTAYMIRLEVVDGYK